MLFSETDRQRLNCWGKVVPISAGFKYVEALGKVIIGGPYPPSDAVNYMHLQL